MVVDVQMNSLPLHVQSAEFIFVEANGETTAMAYREGESFIPSWPRSRRADPNPIKASQ